MADLTDLSPQAQSRGDKEDQMGSVTLIMDDFSTENPYWHWLTMGSGKGYVQDGSAYLTIAVANEGLSAAAIMDPVENIGYPWFYVGMEIRLRCSEDNGLKNGKGGGYRVWGLGDGHRQPIPNNALIFDSFSPQSHSDFVGFWARAIVNNTLTLSTLLEVDMTDWHTYTILWEPEKASFLIDEKIVGTTNKAPRTPLCVYTYIENAFIHRTPNPMQGLRSYGNFRWTNFHLKNDVTVQYDHIYIFRKKDISLPDIRFEGEVKE